MGHQTKSHLKDKAYRIENIATKTRENDDFQVFRISSWQGKHACFWKQQNVIPEKNRRSGIFSETLAVKSQEV